MPLEEQLASQTEPWCYDTKDYCFCSAGGCAKPDKEKEKAMEEMYCEVGDHYVEKTDMWPNFADCKNCCSEKEYEEQMSKTVWNPATDGPAPWLDVTDSEEEATEQIVKIELPLSKFNVALDPIRLEEQISRLKAVCSVPGGVSRCEVRIIKDIIKKLEGDDSIPPGWWHPKDCDGCSECETEVEIIDIPGYYGVDGDKVYYSEHYDTYWLDVDGEHEAKGKLLENIKFHRKAMAMLDERDKGCLTKLRSGNYYKFA